MQVSGASKLKEPGVYDSYLNDNANRFSLSTQQIELVRRIARAPLLVVTPWNKRTWPRSGWLDGTRAGCAPDTAHEPLLSIAGGAWHRAAAPRAHRIQLVCMPFCARCKSSLPPLLLTIPDAWAMLGETRWSGTARG